MLLNKVFKWDIQKFLNATIGEILFCIGLNLFIVPMGLYTGGFLGIAQLIRTLILNIFHIETTIDIAGIINFIFNVPLFIIAYQKISKTFFTRTLWCVAVQTFCLTLIPIPKDPIIDELITSTLIGGVIAGIGSGMILTSRASGGGTDIIGIILSLKDRNLSVGKISLTINIFVYVISGIFFGIETMIYSILYSVFCTIIVDRTHDQNIVSNAMIFTKDTPNQIIHFIEEELHRGVTYWEAYGGFDKSKTYITYATLSKYELQRLERHLKRLDEHAFMVKTEGLGVVGNFQKYL